MRPNDEDRSEIAFFDVETTVPTRSGEAFAILKFGSILVCPRKLVELQSYSTLIRPSDLSLISTLSVRCNGITRDAVVRAPCFSEIADVVHDLLHGRIWAGHNIVRFDCKRIQEAFAKIGRPAPEPKGTIDSLALLTQKFGRRAGDMKMASLATYFGLGQPTHRSLDDVRMNLEVIKYCSTVLFLESSLPDICTEKSWGSPNATTRSQANVAMVDKLVSPDAVSEGCSGYAGFLDPEEMSMPSISACLVAVYRGIQRIRLLHSGLAFQLCLTRLKVRFGISSKYIDATGRPRLSFVVDATQALCQVLDNCDHLAEKLSIESGSSSEWRHVVSRKNGFVCSPTLRLHIPTVNADSPRYATEMYRKESSGKLEKLVFIHCYAAEVATLLNPGTLLDAYISLDHYDYQKNAGIRLVAKKLVIHC